MAWEDFLAEDKDERVFPWVGGRTIYGSGRKWKIQGDLPVEHGWYSFDVGGGRRAVYAGKAEVPFGWESGHKSQVCGYLVGNRLIPDGSRVVVDHQRVLEQTLYIHLVDPGLERFSRARVVNYEDRFYIYACPEFPMGPESEVLNSYLGRASSIQNIREVTPALDLAFRFESWIREQRDERRRQAEERRRQEEERRERERLRQEMVRQIGTGEGRRRLAQVDFETAARSALQVSGAELLDVRDSYVRTEKVIRFRHEQRQWECTTDLTLHVIDSGICLNSHDHLFTLESLPSVISQAIRERRLHVTRRINGDAHDDWEDEDDW